MADGGLAATVGVVGGIVGLIGGLMSFGDRFYKGRPIASLTTGTSGDQKLVFVRIKNTTNYDVMIKRATERRQVYFLTEDFEIGNLLRGQTEGMFRPFMLKPGDSKDLLIRPKFKDGVAVEAMGNRHIDFWLYWRRGKIVSPSVV
ncbi:hypothetical protein FBZ93_1261 [Bradyrhizobium macuxiense]|uniref:Uncharacterized protein n=1 Tax=Bradyrhizobium macuxiense TaxID=1755647 RepID=A0A560L0W3_9BRAD|nr:hypothetical protein [Bradyrhizobium macuxiense]TWB86820.1 hypothetical protein FBZ93_1261 [Bradyrhizobium macuxiense]